MNISTRRGVYATIIATSALVVGTLGGCPPPAGPGGDIAGTWAGDVVYVTTLEAGGPESNGSGGVEVTEVRTVIFDQTGTPNVLDLWIGTGGSLLLPTGDLANVGDIAVETFSTVNPNTGGTTTTTATATVVSVSREQDRFSIVLDLDVQVTGETTGQLSGTYELVAVLVSQDTLDWDSATQLTVAGNVPVSLNTTGIGVLNRQ